jgi:RNA polymerase sigma-54 factor
VLRATLVRGEAVARGRVGAIAQTIGFAHLLAQPADEVLAATLEAAAVNSALCLNLQVEPDSPAEAVQRRRPPFSMLNGSVAEPGWIEDGGDSLYGHVARQIPLLIKDKRHLPIADAWLMALEPSGWVSASPEEIAKEAGCPIGVAREVLGQLQQGEPTGIFARTLKECLALQLEADDLRLPGIDLLLDNLGLLGDGRLADLAEICGTDAKGIAALVGQLRRLDPKPGSSFGGDKPVTRAPDLVLEFDKENGWELRWSQWLRPLVTLQSHPGQDLAGDLQAGRTLMHAIERRDRVIMEVAKTVLDFQSAFMTGARPFPGVTTLRQVADRTGLHETTVGRIRSHLIVAGPAGGMRLAELFQQGVEGVDGELRSVAEIKFRLAAYIRNEAASGRLTDRQLQDLLEQDGIRAARRTVAKYRTELGIPVALSRRS